MPDPIRFSRAYSHEVSSAGFWPGKEVFPQAAFYSYIYPEPASFREVTPGAYFDGLLGEFILPYDTVRNAAEPDALFLDFLSATYVAAAETGGWAREALECPIGIPGQVAASSALKVPAHHEAWGRPELLPSRMRALGRRSRSVRPVRARYSTGDLPSSGQRPSPSLCEHREGAMQSNLAALLSAD